MRLLLPLALALSLASPARAQHCATDFARDVRWARSQPAPRRAPFASAGAIVDDVLVLNATVCDDTSQCTLKAVTGASGEVRYEVNHAAAARQVYDAGIADAYDQLVFFTAFHPTFSGSAYYTPVFNDVRGINFAQDFGQGAKLDELTNMRALFGASSTLKGVVLMGDLYQCGYFAAQGLFRGCTDREPFATHHETIHGILAQELAHAFGAYVRFKAPDLAAPSAALLGRAQAHWSWLLDTGGSPLEGNKWFSNGDTFSRPYHPEVHYSPLDQYLMGVRDAADVPPFRLVEGPSPAIDPATPPELGPPSVTGAPREVFINQVVAAEGPRAPGFKDAAKTLRQLFVLLLLPGDSPTTRAEDVAAVGRIRAFWPSLAYRISDERLRVVATVDGSDEVGAFSFTAGNEGFGDLAREGPAVATGGALRFGPGDVNGGVFVKHLRVHTRGAAHWRLKLRAEADASASPQLSFSYEADQQTGGPQPIPVLPGETRALVFPIPADATLSAATLLAMRAQVTLEDLRVLPGPAPDRDGDAIPDDADNCIATANPDQADLDGDGGGDACDGDANANGILDARERCLNPDGTPCDAEPGCGCASASPLSLAGLAGLLALRRRRSC